MDYTPVSWRKGRWNNLPWNKRILRLHPRVSPKATYEQALSSYNQHNGPKMPRIFGRSTSRINATITASDHPKITSAETSTLCRTFKVSSLEDIKQISTALAGRGEGTPTITNTSFLPLVAPAPPQPWPHPEPSLLIHIVCSLGTWVQDCGGHRPPTRERIQEGASLLHRHADCPA